ncbi:MAG: nucleotidyltransferase domain-containing protein [Thermincola sp.]|nr:nucleotidyltransferase domain-containing protein [Thermincola sp.]MDT3702326.1 nucleotidyltransferase domain-containing protein [Thermincola sp.]
MKSLLQLDNKIKLLPPFFAEMPDVLSVFLFGSYGTTYQTTLSDIDFAVLFDKRIGITDEADFLAKLSAFLETDKVDMVNLNKAPLNLQFRVIQAGNIVYEKDYVTTSDFIEKVTGLYQDFAIDLNYYYKEYDEALKEACSNGR